MLTVIKDRRLLENLYFRALVFCHLQSPRFWATSVDAALQQHWNLVQEANFLIAKGHVFCNGPLFQGVSLSKVGFRSLKSLKNNVKSRTSSEKHSFSYGEEHNAKKF